MRQTQRVAAGAGWLIVALAVLVVASSQADEPAKARPQDRPPWQRLLQGEDARKAAELERRFAQSREAGKFEDALKTAEAIAKLRAKAQGADHWAAVDARWAVEAIRRVVRQEIDARKDYARSFSLQSQAHVLNSQGRYREAQPLLEKSLAVKRRVLGEDHPETAEGYSFLAVNLGKQGTYARAEVLNRRALAIYRKALGEGHPETAMGYGNLAAALDRQGRHRDATELHRRALAIYRKALGEGDEGTGGGYSNLASNYRAQGRYAEAAELDRKSLVIWRKALGEGHPNTALGYDSLAGSLAAQGRYADAEAGFRKALATRRKTRGEEHPETADSYNNLAGCLSAQHRHAEAEAFLRSSFAVYRKMGKEHPRIATCLQNLAFSLRGQGRYAEAEELAREALDFRTRQLGEGHPDTALSYHHLALVLHAQGRYTEAEVFTQKALAIWRETLGEDHIDTAVAYHQLAGNLNAQGKYAKAEAQWARAADAFAKARLRVAPTGLGRAARTGERSPLPPLAAVLARNGKPEKAWRRFEEGLARGTWDDLSARLRRPAAEQDRQAQLAARLDRLDRLIEQTLAAKGDAAEQKARREALLAQRFQGQDELDAFARHLEKTYGPAVGEVFDRAPIQAALPADAALVGWLDLPGLPNAADPNGEHWAVLLRCAGGPVFVRMRGSGPAGAWADADTRLPAELRDAVQSPRGDWRPLARRLREQRLGPLAKHLAATAKLPAVRHLIVLPSPALAGVPAEVFAEGYAVSYAPSGTLYAHLRKQPKPATEGLLALADPVFDAPAVVEKAPPLPPGGALLTMVAPGSNAATAGLKPNDVLLRYGAKDLAGPADLKPAPEASDPAKRVAVTVWREGKTFEWQLRPGKLGVLLAADPAPKALAEQRRLDRRLASATRGGEWQQLPGTRAEVEALRRLFAAGPAPKVLADSQASEQQLDELAKSGELGRYRFLHLATHGAVDDRFPLRSAVILSRDNLPDPVKQLEAGLPAYDGQLTAAEVLERWHLHSELVTLSACQTALGKYERGEGFVGFAQALLIAGSRSVCLSLWKVDDAATALLMERFYANLLGQREGLKGPLGKAAALAEAKDWLRNLSRDEALKRAKVLTKGVERGKGRPTLPLLPALPEAPAGAKDDRPYAHPYYWAAFVLIGDPG